MSFLHSLFTSAKIQKEPPKVAFKKIKGGGQTPLGDWKRASNLIDVVGIQFRRDAATRFAKLIIVAYRKEEYFGLVLEREPTNLADSNAIKVIGCCAGQELHIGYLDRYEAAQLTKYFPTATLAAEFYDLYLSATEYVAIRFFALVPKAIPAQPGDRSRRLLDVISEELIVLNYIVMANGRRSRAETEIFEKYLTARAEDLHFQLYEGDLREILLWLKSRHNTDEEVAIAIERIVQNKSISIPELSDLVEIFVGINNKITVAEREAMEFVSPQLAHTMNSHESPSP